MSTGITRELLPVSQFIIIFLMYCGRVGSLLCDGDLRETSQAARYGPG